MSIAGPWPAARGSPGVQAALAVLADVHDALEDAAGGMPEVQRQALCRGVLTAAGATVLARYLHAGAEQALSALPCMAALVRRIGGVRPVLRGRGRDACAGMQRLCQDVAWQRCAGGWLLLPDAGPKRCRGAIAGWACPVSSSGAV